MNYIANMDKYQLLIFVFSNRSGCKPIEVIRMEMPYYFPECFGGNMMTFICYNCSKGMMQFVFAWQIWILQALYHGYGNFLPNFIANTINFSYLEFWNTQKRLNPIHPLIKQLPTMNDN